MLKNESYGRLIEIQEEYKKYRTEFADDPQALAELATAETALAAALARVPQSVRDEYERQKNAWIYRDPRSVKEVEASIP